jgi:hypothetical protein
MVELRRRCDSCCVACCAASSNSCVRRSGGGSVSFTGFSLSSAFAIHSSHVEPELVLSVVEGVCWWERCPLLLLRLSPVLSLLPFPVACAVS